jgi:hypothetical protein
LVYVGLGDEFPADFEAFLAESPMYHQSNFVSCWDVSLKSSSAVSTALLITQMPRGS